MPIVPAVIPRPEPFLTVREHRTSSTPSLCGLCVGYERQTWRAAQLADHIIEWLPEFALTPSEWLSMQHANSVQFIRRAAQAVYKTEKFKRRGEFGELFLHAAMRQIHDSLPAISKIYYKTAINETVKGFDAVHVVGPPDDMELWLGEAKFYESIGEAINDVIAELETHLGTDYLRSEFLLIKGKIDDAWPHAEPLRKLLSPNTSLDEVFKRACIPVLLTYDSDCVAKHQACTDLYVAEFKAELAKHYSAFVDKLNNKHLPPEVRIHLFLLPLHAKKALVEELDRKLKVWQQI
jgi:hypothetical protein